MAKTKTEQTEDTRSASIDVSPENGTGNALLAAWQGVYHLFGGHAEFDLTDDGVIVRNFSTDAQYDPATILRDISHRNRRLDFLEVYPWFRGDAPEGFADAKEMTAWSVQFFRGAVDENSSRMPSYAKDAVASYKNGLGIAKRRGPKKKIFRVDNLSEIDENTLSGVNADELSKLKASIERALANASANTAGDTNSPVAETANA